MKTYFITILLLLSSCAEPPRKTEPIHSKEITDPELKAMVDSFLDITARKNIKFDHKVSIGFADINDGDTIGTCTYNASFREIDIDLKFWNGTSFANKVCLVYHELAHCYCNRDHDFDDGTMYPDESLKYILQNIFKLQSPMTLEGYLEDGCPKSIMFPKLMDENCFRKHYNYYIEEMLDRCEPY